MQERKKDKPVQTNLKPPSQRKPIHSRNHRFLTHPPTNPPKPTLRVSQGAPSYGFNLILRSQLSLLDQILPGAKCFGASTCDDGHAERRLVVEPGDDGVGFPVCVGWDTVHGVGTVDGDQEDEGSWVGEDEGIRFWGLGAELRRHCGWMSSWALWHGVTRWMRGVR